LLVLKLAQTRVSVCATPYYLEQVFILDA
jgi:hypothetical protein